METPELIGGFKQKFEKFVYLYKVLKEENRQIKLENTGLKNKLEQKEQELDEYRQKLETNNLAKTFLASSGNGQEAKVKINKIVREIDNCIALLNR
jgi:regulator of replication initiation timing